MSKKRKLKKRIKQANKQRCLNPNVTNCHHCLWIGRKWDAGHYSRMLRNYWYCKVYIPANTIHRLIHQEITEIPVPEEHICRTVYYSLLAMENRGEISSKDPIWDRIELIISQFGDKCPATTNALYKQLTVIKEFYKQAVT